MCVCVCVCVCVVCVCVCVCLCVCCLCVVCVSARACTMYINALTSLCSWWWCCVCITAPKPLDNKVVNQLVVVAVNFAHSQLTCNSMYFLELTHVLCCKYNQVDHPMMGSFIVLVCQLKKPASRNYSNQPRWRWYNCACAMAYGLGVMRTTQAESWIWCDCSIHPESEQCKLIRLWIGVICSYWS